MNHQHQTGTEVYICEHEYILRDSETKGKFRKEVEDNLRKLKSFPQHEIRNL